MKTGPAHIHEISVIYDALHKDTLFSSVFNQLPNMGLVVNQDRSVVFINQKLLSDIGMSTIHEVLGMRPGELIQCIHTRGQVRCGDARGCRHCDAIAAVEESMTSGVAVTKNARVTIQPENQTVSLDLQVTATPLRVDSLWLTMVFFSDISSQKRREYLEKVFLHDTRNTLTALTMMGDLMSLKKLPEDLRNDLHALQKYVNMLTEDIDVHQMLIDAEAGTLRASFSNFPLQEIVDECLQSIARFAQMASVKVMLDLDHAPDFLHTDRRLLRRLLVNTLKNAIEATPSGGEVRLKVVQDAYCIFEITNPTLIDEATREKIFQRSFSTKGEGRGLGTYSMRLLLETYLGGEISFTSENHCGTSFRIRLAASD